MGKIIISSSENKNPFTDLKFTNFFNELYPSLCRYCLSLVGEREIAEDIVQDQFLYLWENRDRLKDVGSMKSYIFRAVKNRSINYLERNFRKYKSLNIEEDFPTDGFIFSLDPSIIAEGKELEKIIEKALASLPLKCHAIFSLKRFGNLTNKEIAKELNISIKTVETQMSIAIKKLSEFISSHWSGFLLLISAQFFILI